MTATIWNHGALAPISDNARLMFWAKYLEWQTNASEEELDQLRSALEVFESHEVIPITTLIRNHLALNREHRASKEFLEKLPLSLVEQLKDIRWQPAAAGG